MQKLSVFLLAVFIVLNSTGVGEGAFSSYLVPSMHHSEVFGEAAIPPWAAFNRLSSQHTKNSFWARAQAAALLGIGIILITHSSLIYSQSKPLHKPVNRVEAAGSDRQALVNATTQLVKDYDQLQQATRQASMTLKKKLPIDLNLQENHPEVLERIEAVLALTATDPSLKQRPGMEWVEPIPLALHHLSEQEIEISKAEKEAAEAAKRLPSKSRQLRDQINGTEKSADKLLQDEKKEATKWRLPAGGPKRAIYNSDSVLVRASYEGEGKVVIEYFVVDSKDITYPTGQESKEVWINFTSYRFDLAALSASDITSTVWKKIPFESKTARDAYWKTFNWDLIVSDHDEPTSVAQTPHQLPTVTTPAPASRPAGTPDNPARLKGVIYGTFVDIFYGPGGLIYSPEGLIPDGWRVTAENEADKNVAYLERKFPSRADLANQAQAALSLEARPTLITLTREAFNSGAFPGKSQLEIASAYVAQAVVNHLGAGAHPVESSTHEVSGAKKPAQVKAAPRPEPLPAPKVDPAVMTAIQDKDAALRVLLPWVKKTPKNIQSATSLPDEIVSNQAKLESALSVLRDKAPAEVTGPTNIALNQLRLINSLLLENAGLTKAETARGTIDQFMEHYPDGNFLPWLDRIKVGSDILGGLNFEVWRLTQQYPKLQRLLSPPLADLRDSIQLVKTTAANKPSLLAADLGDKKSDLGKWSTTNDDRLPSLETRVKSLIAKEPEPGKSPVFPPQGDSTVASVWLDSKIGTPDAPAIIVLFCSIPQFSSVKEGLSVDAKFYVLKLEGNALVAYRATDHFDGPPNNDLVTEERFEQQHADVQKLKLTPMQPTPTSQKVSPQPSMSRLASAA